MAAGKDGASGLPLGAQGATATEEVVVVAPRRTVRADGKRHNPGSAITVSAADAAFLRRGGFVVSSGAPPPPVGNGPTYAPATGPMVTKAGG